MRQVAVAIVTAVVGVASAHAASESATTQAFFKGLACRNAQVLGGQNDMGAILYHDPMEERSKERVAGGWNAGTLIYRHSEAVQPLGVFRILPADPKNREKPRVRTVFSSNGGMLAIFDYVKRSAETKSLLVTER